MSARQPQNIEEHHRSLKVVHFAMCFGVSIIFLILYFYIRHESLSFKDSPGSIPIFAMFIAAIVVIFSNIIFRKKTNTLSTMSMKNVEDWREGYIVKWALLEGGALINIIIYFFIQAHPILLVIAMMLILLLYVSKPKTNLI